MSRRSQRGHVLVEVMVSGAVLLFALTGIVESLIQASTHTNIAAHDGMAMALAEQQLDQLRIQPLATWLANAGSSTSAACAAPHANWTCAVTYSALATDAFGASAPAGVAPGQFITATVSVTFPVSAAATRAVTLQALRWKDQ